MKKFLSILLVAVMLVGMLPATVLTAFAADTTTATLSFADKAQRTSFSSTKQVWEQNGIKFTNDKASSTNAVADYAAPVRLYKSSTITIEYSKPITKIEFSCTSGYSSIPGTTLKNNVATYTLATPATSCTITLSGGQVRFNSLTVYYQAGGEDTSCKHENLTSTGSDDKQHWDVCECGEKVNVATHNYVDGVCSCGKEQPAGSNFVLVTSVSDLTAGDQVIIVAKGSDFAMSTEQKTNNRGQVAITKVGNAIAVEEDSDVEIFTLEVGKATGTFAFKDNSPDVNNKTGYLYAAGSSGNHLKTETTMSTQSSWKITIAGDGTASVVAQDTSVRGTMQYNETSSLFACYASASQKPIAIYKLDKGTEASCEHKYTNDCDANCDICNATREVGEHVDTTPKNHECDTCGVTVGDPHKAAAGTHICAYCRETMSQCADGDDKNHTCDVCGGKVDGEACVDGDDNDHNCDECGAKLSECADGDDKNHTCDVCGGEVVGEVCTDEGRDHVCDECGATVGEHKQADKKHICDYCQEVLTTCDDYWVAGEYVKPTFESNGYTPYTCSICDATKKEYKDDTKLEAVAIIGEKKFETLQEALDAATNGDVVILQTNIAVSRYLDVYTANNGEIARNFTLDLNGKTIAPADDYKVSDYALLFIGLKQTLTIMDSSEEQTGKIISNSKVTVGTYGILNLVGGTIISNGTDAENDAAVDIYYWGGGEGYADVATGTGVISGGTIDGTLWSGGDLTITGGTIETLEVYDGKVVINGVEIANISAVAKIDNAYYATVADAFEAAKANDTIVLLADVEATVVLPAGVKLDLNGKTIKGNIVGTVSMNNGTWITPDKDYVMAGPNASYYKTTDAVLTLDAAGNIVVEDGTLTLAQSWWTGKGQTLTIAEGAEFVIPAGMSLNVLSTVVIEGTVIVNGTVNLYDAEATITSATAIPNVVTTVSGSKVVYENGVYSVRVQPRDEATSISLSLRGNIGFKVYYALSAETLADKNAYVVFMIDGEEIGRQYVSEASGPDSDGDYAFECEVAAAQMTKKITIQLVYGDGTVGKAYESSVKDYAVKRINNESASEEVKALLRAMLNYGAYAQLHFEYNTGDLANTGVNNLPSIEGITADTIKQSSVQNGKATGIAIDGYSTLLESETTFKFSFALESGANIADYTFSYVNEEGETVVLLPKLDVDGTYCVYIEDIPAAYLDRMYTVTVVNNKDNTSYSIESCVLCYAKSVIKNTNNTVEKINMAKALYLYSQAANEYFGQ